MNNIKNIPIFPLKSIILPGGQFPLRIFERRYIDMIRNALKDDDTVSILRGLRER